MVRPMASKLTPSRGVRAGTGSKARHVLAGDERGQSAVEFALIFPFLAIVLLGIIWFGIAFWNQITLTQAAVSAAQVAAVSRTTTPVDLCTPVNTAIASAAPSLQNPNVYGSFPLSFGIQVGSTAAKDSNGNTSWRVVFGGGSPGTCPVLLTQGQQVTVSVSYGCNLSFFNSNFAPNCKLSAQTSEAIQ